MGTNSRFYIIYSVIYSLTMVSKINCNQPCFGLNVDAVQRLAVSFLIVNHFVFKIFMTSNLEDAVKMSKNVFPN